MRRRSLLTAAAATVGAGSSLTALGATNRAAPAAAPTPPARNAPSSADLLLGQSAVLSGPLGQQVRLMNAGAQLVLDAFNANGGAQGRKLRLVSVDDQQDPARALANHRNLLREQAPLAFFGCVGSATTAAVEPLLREAGVPALAGYGVSDAVRRKCQGVAYFVRATYGDECDMLVRQLTTVGITRIGVASLAEPAGEEIQRLIGRAMAEHKLEVAVAASVRSDGADLGEAARKLLGLQPQAIIMYLSGQLAAGLVDIMAKAGQRPGFYGLSSVTPEQVIERLGDRARGIAMTQAVPYPWQATDPDTLAFRRAAQAAKLPVGYASFEGWLNARVLVEALQRCGGEYSPSRLHAVLRKMQWRVAGWQLDFGAGGHSASHFVELVQIAQGGQLIR